MTEREVLKLALEALEVVEPHTFPDSDAELFSRSAITACREALAQQQEPVAYGMWDTMIGKGNRMMMVRLDKGQDGCTVPLYTTPPQPEPVIDKSAAVRIATALGWEPKRKPLTDEQLEVLWDEATDCMEHFCSQYWDFARAIEAAHGIKE